ncbi:unnamed protein product [Ilex paraguariensis]|uniref:3'-5' exonuclease domain-containing protein n=1 Tax=Ilex paraguariensis TaxID=185542 RepID=A0ABC8S3X3_9AQUA
MEYTDQKPLTTHFVSATDSPGFTHLSWALPRSSVIGLDAEWKPIRTRQDTFPTVCLLQIACRLVGNDDSTAQQNESLVFLLDLSTIPLSSIYELMKDVFVSPHILKLGFLFKQDLVFLSSTFCSQGCDPGFDRVEPYFDIASIYNYLQHNQPGRKMPKETKGLSTICEEILGFSLSKKSRRHMQLLMHTVCLRYLISSRSKLPKKGILQIWILRL